MPTTLENTLIRFNDGTTQSTAATTPPAASTAVAGIVQLSTATDSTSTTLAATASAVKAAYDLAASKANASHSHSYLGYDIGFNTVGSIGLVTRFSGTTLVSSGGTIAGSNLRVTSVVWNTSTGAVSFLSGTTLSGTWRIIGGELPSTHTAAATLAQRIS